MAAARSPQAAYSQSTASALRAKKRSSRAAPRMTPEGQLASVRCTRKRSGHNSVGRAFLSGDLIGSISQTQDVDSGDISSGRIEGNRRAGRNDPNERHDSDGESSEVEHLLLHLVVPLSSQPFEIVPSPCSELRARLLTHV